MSSKDWYPEVLKLRGRIAELEGSLEEWQLDFKALKEENQRLKVTCKWCGTIHRANENTLCPVTQKDKRIKELQEENQRLKDTIKRVRELPKRWRDEVLGGVSARHDNVRDCADDLQAALKEQSDAPNDRITNDLTRSQ